MRVSVPVVTSVLLFSALVGSTQYERRQVTTAVASRDSVRRLLTSEITYAFTIFSPGDTLPAAALQGLGRPSTTLRELDRRFRYVVFRKPGCAACKELDALLPSIPQSVRDSIALIDVGATADTLSHPEMAHFLWTRDSVARGQFVHYVPAVIIRDTEGRVLAAGHGSFLRAFGALDVFGVLPKRIVDSVRTFDPTLAALADGTTQRP